MKHLYNASLGLSAAIPTIVGRGLRGGGKIAGLFMHID